MTIMVDENLIGLWFVTFKDNKRDWMGGLSRRADGGFTFLWRTRHRVDDKVWGSEDRKSWAEAKTRASEQQALHSVRMVVASLMSEDGGEESYEVLVGDKTPEEVSAAIAALPMAHQREMSEAEYRAEYGADAPMPKP